MKKIALSALLLFALICVVSCKCTQKASEAVLTNNSWELSMLNGKAPNPADFQRILPTVTFAADNTISGNGGCNGYRGTYTIGEDGSFKTDKVVATKMYCEDAKGENEFFKALGKADKIKTEKNRIALLHEDKEVMVFVPKTE